MGLIIYNDNLFANIDNSEQPIIPLFTYRQLFYRYFVLSDQMSFTFYVNVVCDTLKKRVKNDFSRSAKEWPESEF